MHSPHFSAQILPAPAKKKPAKPYRGVWLNFPITAVGLLLCLPIFLFNSLLALVKGVSIFQPVQAKGVNGEDLWMCDFSVGVLRASARLFSVLAQDISLCGYPMNASLETDQLNSLQARFTVPVGLVDAVTLHRMTGLAIDNPVSLLEKQFRGNSQAYLTLCLKGLFCYLMYSRKKALQQPSHFKLFGLNVNNDTMTEAVTWLKNDKSAERCEVGMFVNANSVNLTAQQPKLSQYINQADKVFCDGSGMRLAAQSAGYQLRDNLNGTDMLPHLCQAMQKHNKSLFLLGAKPGIAEQAARNLQKRFPNLTIAGVRDGYFSEQDNQDVINQINQSGAHTLLVALGSPMQEEWLIRHAKQLQCDKALIVGGLLDFYSGAIPRAPMWMRETGLEWIWRLLMEPKTKFTRYVVGTPLFLLRIFLFNQAVKGI